MTKVKPSINKETEVSKVNALERKVLTKLNSAAVASAKLASLKIKNLDTTALDNPQIYSRYSEAIELVQNSAAIFAMAKEQEKSKKYWKIAGTMYLDLLMEGLRDSEKSIFNLKGRILEAKGAIKAAKNAQDPELLATIDHTSRSILKLYSHSIDSANEDIDEVLDASLKQIQR